MHICAPAAHHKSSIMLCSLANLIVHNPSKTVIFRTIIIIIMVCSIMQVCRYKLIHCNILISWYCHFDDDSYVNVPALIKLLDKHKGKEENLYLGHYPSLWSGHAQNLRPKANWSYPEIVSESSGHTTVYKITDLYIQPAG